MKTEITPPVIIEQRDSAVREVLALYGIDDIPLPVPPFNKAFTFLDLPGYWAMVQIDAYHPVPADNGLTLIMLPAESFSEDSAREFFQECNQIDQKTYESTHPVCAV